MVHPETDMRGLQFMPLDVVRLMDSDLFALSTGDEFKAAVALWCKAWLQIPAASLPDDERILAHLSGAGARWKKVRGMALRGFVKCSDGRFYHPVIAQKAADAWAMRLRQRERSAKGNEKRWGQQKPSSSDPHGDPRGDRKGQGQGQGQLIDAPSGASARAALDRIERACREAAGLAESPSPGLCDLSPIVGLIDQGADLDGDILPALRAKPNQRAKSWAYFVPQIQESRARRRAAADAPLPQVEAPMARAGPVKRNPWVELEMQERAERERNGCAENRGNCGQPPAGEGATIELAGGEFGRHDFG